MASRDDDENPFAAPQTDLQPEEYEPSSREIEYANFWQRFVAAIVDGFLLQIVGFPLGFGIGIMGAASQVPEELIQLLAGLSGLIVGWLYSALQESSEAQATLGKRLMGLIVVDMNGERLTFGRATGRHFGKIPSGMICAVGYLMQPFTEKKQALHDIMANTLVVKA